METSLAVEGVEPRARAVRSSFSIPGWIYALTGMVALWLIGSWLVWFSAYLQRTMAEEDIRAACRRAMPETAERCFDTVVIQRGGIRR